MIRKILIILVFPFTWGENINDLDYNSENQILKLQKGQDIISIVPNQKLFINDSLMVYHSIDYNNKLIKFEAPTEIVLSFKSVYSFRYQNNNILNSLQKAWHYKNIGCTLGCLYGCYGTYVLVNRPNEIFAAAKLFAPIYLIIYSGVGGILGGVAGGLLGYIYPSYSEKMIIGKGEWEIIVPRSIPQPI